MGDLTQYRPGLGLIGVGAVLWIAGLLVTALVPVVGSIGVVLVLFGQILFWIGVAVLVLQIIIGLFRGL